MTTVVFRKKNNLGQMASDSRVTWVSQERNLPIKWFDSIDYMKTISIDGVLYGFAGANVMFKSFLEYYNTKEDSQFLLDTLVLKAKERRVQFSIISYDGICLKLFSYSPQNEQMPEIFRISRDPSIDRNYYGIGSGSQSKMYKKFKINACPKLPIHKIIKANIEGLRKEGMLNISEMVLTRQLSDEEAERAYFACTKKGGDVSTGGEVRVCKESDKTQMKKQIEIMNKMDVQAKAAGAVCASPFNASLEVKHLERIGHYAVSPHKLEMTSQRKYLLDKIEETLNASI